MAGAVTMAGGRNNILEQEAREQFRGQACSKQLTLTKARGTYEHHPDPLQSLVPPVTQGAQ